jgi:HAD superfamily hydrolase (TIGR01450 family)
MNRSNSLNSLKNTVDMKHKACVFDLDGVLRVGKDIIQGSEYLLRHLNERGIKTMILTNECRYTVEELKDELSEIGLYIPEDTIIYTAACAARDYLKDKLKRFPNRKLNVCVIGELGLYETIMELQEYANFISCSNKEEDENTELYVVLGTVNKIKINHLNKLLKLVQKGAKIITTCKDISDPASKGDFNLGMPMHILHMIGFNVNRKIHSYSTGKPNPRIGKYIYNSLKNNISKPDDILFVGDTIYTDIQLAEECGFDSCLVLSGNTKKDTANMFTIEPDFILENINYLNDIL